MNLNKRKIGLTYDLDLTHSIDLDEDMYKVWVAWQKLENQIMRYEKSKFALSERERRGGGRDKVSVMRL